MTGQIPVQGLPEDLTKSDCMQPGLCDIDTFIYEAALESAIVTELVSSRSARAHKGLIDGIF